VRLFGFVGWSGSGKTTLIVALIDELTRRGLRVSALKHTHHTVDLDQPGKDTYRFREAGAVEVGLASSSRWTLMREVRDGVEPTPSDMAQRMAAVDLLLVEGFKGSPHDKIEVHRPSLGRSLLCTTDQRVVAVASDAPIDGVNVPVLPLNDTPAIAEFVVNHCGLSAAVKDVTRRDRG
jgi:molybdopterin-guanine dinucleotide biosynthesis protein B